MYLLAASRLHRSFASLRMTTSDNAEMRHLLGVPKTSPSSDEVVAGSEALADEYCVALLFDDHCAFFGIPGVAALKRSRAGTLA